MSTTLDNDALGRVLSFLSLPELLLNASTVSKQWKAQADALQSRPAYWQTIAQLIQLKIPGPEDRQPDNAYATRLKLQVIKQIKTRGIIFSDAELKLRFTKILAALDFQHLKRYEIGVWYSADQEVLPVLQATLSSLTLDIQETNPRFGAPHASFSIIMYGHRTHCLGSDEDELLSRVSTFIGTIFSKCCLCVNDHVSLVAKTRSYKSQNPLCEIFLSCLREDLKKRFHVVKQIKQ